MIPAIPGRLSIRRYAEGDREPVRRLHDFAMREAGIHLGKGCWYEDLDRIEAEYLDDGGEFLVGTVDDEIVAAGALKKTSEDRAEIKYMRVDPRLQRRGYGQSVLLTLETRAAELGFGALHLDTAVKQYAARALYEINGYRETHQAQKGGLDCVFYEKSLA